MQRIKLGVALGTVALSGLMGAGVGVGYFLVKVADRDKKRTKINGAHLPTLHHRLEG